MTAPALARADRFKPEGALRLHVEPISSTLANQYITAVHRHHGPFPQQFSVISIAAVTEEGEIRGVATLAFAIAGNRLTDGFRTAEVTRVATDGTPNACSILYGACARAAKALGFSRIITYVLTTESGTSVKAAGWTQDEGDFGNISWADHTKRPGTGSNFGPKGRWSLTFQTLHRPDAKPPGGLLTENVMEVSFFDLLAEET